MCLTTVGAPASSAVFFPAFVAYVTSCVLPAIFRLATVPDGQHVATAIELSVLLLVLLVSGRATKTLEAFEQLEAFVVTLAASAPS